MTQYNRTMTSDDYRYGFNGKERDADLTGNEDLLALDYGFRIYNPAVGRFLSVDPITRKYPMLTPYQFASNTPIQAIDLDGLEAFYVHGTWSDPSAFPVLTKTTINEIFGNTEGKTFGWSGNNGDAGRQRAARDLAEHIVKYRDPNQPLTLVGHSHGGNVDIIATNILKDEYGIEVDNLITINTPVREYQLNEGVTAKHFNFYHKGDPVQVSGGNDFIVPDLIINNNPVYLGGLNKPTGEVGKAGRKFKGARNIKIEKGGILEFHNTQTKAGLIYERLKDALDFNLEAIVPIDFETQATPQDNTKLILPTIKTD